MFVSFQTNPPDTTSCKTLAYDLGIGPNVRFRTMANGTKLVYEDNPEDVIQCWVAEKRRTGILTPETKYKPVYGLQGAIA